MDRVTIDGLNAGVEIQSSSTKPGLRVRAQASSNAIEVQNPDGSVAWSVDHAGNPSSGGGGGSGLFPIISGKSAYVPSTGVAATDTAAIQAAHDAFGVNGGTIAVDAGPYAITGGVINFTKPIHMLGCGPGGPTASTYVTSAFGAIGTKMTVASGSSVGITVNADYCTFEKLYMVNTSGTTPTAGCAIQIATHGAHTRFIDCAFDSFYKNVEFLYGYSVIVDRCYFQNFVHSALHMLDGGAADWGDNTVANSYIYAGPQSNSAYGIYWESGGGLRVNNSKFNISDVGDVPKAAILSFLGAGASTADLIVTGCSLENWQNGIYVGNQGAGTFINVVVTGNEFSSVAGAGTEPIIVLGSAPSHISNVVITGNKIDGGAGSVIRLGNVDKVILAGNSGSVQVSDGGVTNLKMDGYAFSTAARPAATVMAPGSWYYDTTLAKPAWSNGTNWKDAAGTNV